MPSSIDEGAKSVAEDAKAQNCYSSLKEKMVIRTVYWDPVLYIQKLQCMQVNFVQNEISNPVEHWPSSPWITT